MKILLDTHCWLWWFLAPERMSERAKEIIAEPRNELFLSAASAWEIAIKCGLGKLSLPSPPEQYVPDRMSLQGMQALPIHHSHALQVAVLPKHHSDPFDRLLIAQAQMERLTLMTADPQFRPYAVDLLWAA